ncbi:hypothetical protein F511_17463 [Dorcoceras hygrometricum]|uniref:Uncharacterized protein n=1 Tax=Dorcoceras hygrometricum TaxID=472368 RepID=A0A2Z7CFA9_9LAMI|nr:hypothetical protein F511_17463 [Dorcoceras hygrometricum]
MYVSVSSKSRRGKSSFRKTKLPEKCALVAAIVPKIQRLTITKCSTTLRNDSEQKYVSNLLCTRREIQQQRKLESMQNCVSLESTPPVYIDGGQLSPTGATLHPNRCCFTRRGAPVEESSSVPKGCTVSRSDAAFQKQMHCFRKSFRLSV